LVKFAEAYVDPAVRLAQRMQAIASACMDLEGRRPGSRKLEIRNREEDESRLPGNDFGFPSQQDGMRV